MFNTRDLEGFVCRANEVLELKFVRNEREVLDDSLRFSPTFTHQVFGDKETIFGYKNLKIKLYYRPDTLDTYGGISFDEKLASSEMKPDDIIGSLAKYIPPGFTTNLDHFLSLLSKPVSFTPFGEKLHQYNRGDLIYEVYKVDIGYPGFRQYHERLQTFLLWFVDAASFIDADDDKWTFYLLFQKDVENGQPCYAIVGYITLYSFYAYPDKIRSRISQIVVLPPFRRRGHASELLQTVYNDLILNPSVLDITVEDASEQFTALRDYVDCSNALKLCCFQPPAVHEPFSKETAEICRKKLKLSKRQAQKVYEILRLKATDRSNSAQYKRYRLAVKKRLNAPYKRETESLKRLQPFLDPAEVAVMQPPESHDDHMTKLQELYLEVESGYLKYIEKLATIV